MGGDETEEVDEGDDNGVDRLLIGAAVAGFVEPAIS